MCCPPLIKMISPCYPETHCHYYPVDQTYLAHERTNSAIVTLPCKSALLSRSWENKTDLHVLSPLPCELDSVWSDHVYQFISPSNGMLGQYVELAPPRLLCPSNHLYTWQVRGHPRVQGLFWEQIFFTELAWGLYCRNHGELCSFVFQVFTSLFHCWPVCHCHICSRLWPLLGLKPGPQVHVLFT